MSSYGNIDQLKEYINQQLIKLKDSQDIQEIKRYMKEIQHELEKLTDAAVIAEYKKETVYQENDFSASATAKSIMKAKQNAVDFLSRLQFQLETAPSSAELITEEIALYIINRVLENFYSHIEEMYESKVHGKGHITKDKLAEIKIGNEYDVQRMLYSILKPIFPEARCEVSNDTGYGTVRYDIFIEKYNTVIEVKCSRPSMSDKQLREELGSDIYHYQYSNVFFFIYDKNKIISNKVAFTNTYTGEFDGKKIKTILIQPISL